MNAPNKECLWSFSTPPSSCSGSERCVSSGASKGFSRQGRTKPIAGQRRGLRAGVKVWDGGERTSSSVVPSTPPTKLHLFFPFRWEGLNISLELLFFFFFCECQSVISLPVPFISSRFCLSRLLFTGLCGKQVGQLKQKMGV